MSKVVLPRLNQTGANEWADVESNDVALRDIINGGIDNENIKAGAGITGEKIANSTISEKNLSDSAATSRKVSLTNGIKTPSADLICSAAWADVAGTTLEITPAVASIMKVTLVCQFDLSGNAGWEGTLAGTINVDGTRQNAYAIYKAESAHQNEIFGASVSQVYRLELSAAAHTIKMQGIQLGALNLTTSTLWAAYSRYLWELTAA